MLAAEDHRELAGRDDGLDLRRELLEGDGDLGRDLERLERRDAELHRRLAPEQIVEGLDLGAGLEHGLWAAGGAAAVAHARLEPEGDHHGLGRGDVGALQGHEAVFGGQVAQVGGDARAHLSNSFEEPWRGRSRQLPRW